MIKIEKKIVDSLKDIYNQIETHKKKYKFDFNEIELECYILEKKRLKKQFEKQLKKLWQQN